MFFGIKKKEEPMRTFNFSNVNIAEKYALLPQNFKTPKIQLEINNLHSNSLPYKGLSLTHIHILI